MQGLSSQKKDKKEIIDLYEKRLKHYGVSVKTLGWRDRKQQILRFQMLAKVGNLKNKKILDIGCGFGDLYRYLVSKNLKCIYKGIDIAPKIIRAAKKKNPELDVEVKDILKDDIGYKPDYAVASGILSKKNSGNLDYAKKIIRKMYKISTLGIAINMFTDMVDFMGEELFYHPTEKIMKFASSLGGKANIKRNYPLYDYTLYIRKDTR